MVLLEVEWILCLNRMGSIKQDDCVEEYKEKNCCICMKPPVSLQSFFDLFFEKLAYIWYTPYDKAIECGFKFIKKYAEDLGRKPEDESVPAEGWKYKYKSRSKERI